MLGLRPMTYFPKKFLPAVFIMTKVKNYIGIDISKNWLDVAVLRKQSPVPSAILAERFDNDANGLKKLKKQLVAIHVPFNKSTLVVCENTGIYKAPLINFLKKERCQLCVEHAQRIKQSLGIQRGKNDKIDAKRIAEYALTNENRLAIWQNPRKEIQILKDLLNNRDRLITIHLQIFKWLQECRKFSTKAKYEMFSKANKAVISGVDKSRKSVDQEIRAIIKNDSDIQQNLQLLMSVPGIGIVIGLKLLCYTNEFTLCKSGKQLACYVGVAPFEHSSGSSVRGKTRVSSIANKRLKALLHMGAISVLRRKDGELSKYYERKVAEGKNKLSVLNAIKNKIVLRAFAVVDRGTPYLGLSKRTRTVTTYRALN